MKIKLHPAYWLLAILVITSLSCNFVTKGIKSSGPEANQPAAPQAKESSSDLLAEEYRSESGGFSIRKVQGYTFEDVIGIVNMYAPNAKPETGPGIMVMGGLNDTDSTNEQLLEKARRDSSALTFAPARKMEIDGVQALVMEVEGKYDGQSIKGRMVIAMVTPRQQFTLLGLAPTERWEEIPPVLEAVLGSVKFFEANPEANAAPTGESEPLIVTEAAPTEEPAASDPLLRQWAVSAKASSQYGDPSWSAAQATGEPNVNDCGDNGSAWASLKSNSIEWIELSYATPVTPTEINIYQSFNPSQVVEVMIIDTQGDKYIAWAGEPESVENCPDLMTITLELDEKILINKIRVTVDQRVMKVGWNEIDAVELVGYSEDGQAGPAAQPDDQPPQTSTGDDPAPTNFSGWMAGPVYQGYLKVIPGKTTAAELDGLMGLTGKRSTENWKPRPDHADTFIYNLGKDNMLAWISVTTDGVVYKKSISSNTYPSDFQLSTVTKKSYDQLNAIFQRDQVIPYNVAANTLQSPGFLRELWLREDGKMVATYEWFNAAGDHISGFFYDGKLTGMAGLAYISK